MRYVFLCGLDCSVASGALLQRTAEDLRGRLGWEEYQLTANIQAWEPIRPDHGLAMAECYHQSPGDRTCCRFNLLQLVSGRLFPNVA